MNGPAENTAHGAFEPPDQTDTVLSLGTARRMLPLVRRIVADILRYQRRLAELLPEQERLDRRRRTLAWPERCRRYQLQEEVRAAEAQLQEVQAELEGLGVALLDRTDGRLGFPTIVNDSRAFFSWRPGEEGVRYWHFAGETVRRLIPASWTEVVGFSRSSKKG
jgi:hypothetical protein